MSAKKTKDDNLTASPEGQEATETVNKAQEVDVEENASLESEIADLEKQIKKSKKDVAKQQVEVEEPEEKVEEPEEEPEEQVEYPDKFKNKSEKERLEIYRNMEKGYTELSTKKKELEAELDNLKRLQETLQNMEQQATNKQQQTQLQKPAFDKDKFYNEGADYLASFMTELDDYHEKKSHATVQPLYKNIFQYQKSNYVNHLKEQTKDSPIPYAEVEKEVEQRIYNNPKYASMIPQQGMAIRETVYNDLIREREPEVRQKEKERMRQEILAELEQERKDKSHAGVLESDNITVEGKTGRKKVNYNEMSLEQLEKVARKRGVM